MHVPTTWLALARLRAGRAHAGHCQASSSTICKPTEIYIDDRTYIVQNLTLIASVVPEIWLVPTKILTVHVT